MENWGCEHGVGGADNPDIASTLKRVTARLAGFVRSSSSGQVEQSSDQLKCPWKRAVFHWATVV